jgi:hypothetical protein
MRVLCSSAACSQRLDFPSPGPRPRPRPGTTGSGIDYARFNFSGYGCHTTSQQGGIRSGGSDCEPGASSDSAQPSQHHGSFTGGHTGLVGTGCGI